MGIFSLKKEKVLYFPGCLTKGVLKKELQNYKDILNRLKIDFVLLGEEEFCCGLPVANAGYKKDARKLAKKNFEIFKKNKISKIVTSCPSCYHTFKNIYPNFVRDWDIKVEHIIITILESLKKRGIRYKGKDENKKIVTYHDSCHLGRYSGIYEEPRELIRILGGEVKEFKHNKKDAFCCGAGGGFRANFSKTAKEIAKKKIEYMPKDAEYVISACGLCHSNIKTATDRGIEFSTFILEQLEEI